MFKLYLKAAFIGLTRYKLFSAINIIGLAVSLTAFILMALYIEDERSYGHFQDKATHLYTLSAVATFILILACVNFINLSTARAAARAKEIAVKKVTGAARRQLIAQFYLESFFTTILALLTALILTNLLLPAFNHFAGKQLTPHLFSQAHIIALFALLVIVSLLSGTYPALVLSAFKPAPALKGRACLPVLDMSVRKILVIFQFAVSIILVICSIVIWQQLHFMERHNLDELFNHQYKTETKFSLVINLFSVLAIFIACLGLFGLALFSIRQRTKEISIRKVLGAGAPRIVLMLSKEFTKYIAIATIIATPLAWTAMQQWLQDFAYRIIVHWWVFVLAALLVLVIALVTISFHTIKAAMADPVRSLRTE